MTRLAAVAPLDVIRAWVAQVKADGQVPTRVPSQYADAGQLAARVNGPGTKYPNDTSAPVYIVAPMNVLMADAQVAGLIASDQTGYFLDMLKLFGLAPGIAGNNANPPIDWGALQKYLLLGTLAVGAFVILPPLLNAIGGRRR